MNMMPSITIDILIYIMLLAAMVVIISWIDLIFDIMADIVNVVMILRNNYFKRATRSRAWRDSQGD